MSFFLFSSSSPTLSNISTVVFVRYWPSVMLSNYVCCLPLYYFTCCLLFYLLSTIVLFYLLNLSYLELIPKAPFPNNLLFLSWNMAGMTHGFCNLHLFNFSWHHYSVIHTNGYHNRATLIGIVSDLKSDTTIRDLLATGVSHVSVDRWTVENAYYWRMFLLVQVLTEEDCSTKRFELELQMVENTEAVLKERLL